VGILQAARVADGGDRFGQGSERVERVGVHTADYGLRGANFSVLACTTVSYDVPKLVQFD
jgi:hypothetical protein